MESLARQSIVVLPTRLQVNICTDYRAPTSEALATFSHNRGTYCAQRPSPNLPFMAAMDLDGAESKSLFAQVQFFIVQAEDLQGDSAREVHVPTHRFKDQC